jgi:hypothetical protein
MIMVCPLLPLLPKALLLVKQNPWPDQGLRSGFDTEILSSSASTGLTQGYRVRQKMKWGEACQWIFLTISKDFG